MSVSFIHELHAQDAFRGSFQRSGPLIGNAVLGVEFDDAFDRERHADGVLLSGIRPGSAAEEAGLEAGDVIVRFNGLDLTEPLDQADEARIDPGLAPPAARLLVLARQLRHGDEVSLVVRRDGQERQVDLTARWMPPHALDFQGLVQRGRDGGTVILRPAPDALRFDRDTIMVWPRGMPTPPRELAEMLQRFSPVQRRFGVQLHDLNEGLARYFGRTEGALVLEVSEDAPLALEPGDVIVAIAGREVEDADHASRILASYRSGEEVEVHVWREGQNVTVRGEAP